MRTMRWKKVEARRAKPMRKEAMGARGEMELRAVVRRGRKRRKWTRTATRDCRVHA
jgi:hypothetical protein